MVRRMGVVIDAIVSEHKTGKLAAAVTDFTDATAGASFSVLVADAADLAKWAERVWANERAATATHERLEAGRPSVLPDIDDAFGAFWTTLSRVEEYMSTDSDRARSQVTAAATVGGQKQLDRLRGVLQSRMPEILFARERRGTYQQELVDGLEATAATLRADLDAGKQEAGELFSSLKSAAARLQTDLGSARTEMADLGAKVAATTTAEAFVSAKNSNKWAARGWYAVAFCALAALAGVAFYGGDLMAEGHLAVDILAKKVVAAFVLTTGSAIALRNARSEAHSRIVNLHRANALRTFQLFYDEEFPEEVRQAALIQAMGAAFSVQDTGLIGGKTELPPVQDTARAVAEVLRKPAKT